MKILAITFTISIIISASAVAYGKTVYDKDSDPFFATFNSSADSNNELEGLKLDLSIEPQIGHLSGYTLYHISFPGGASELEWPVDNTFAGINTAVKISDFTLEFKAKRNISRDTGKMKDSDWFGNQLSIYSESDTDMDMFDLDINGRYEFHSLSNGNIGVIAGFRSQEFSFHANNVVQKDLTGIHPEYTGSVAGLVGKYNVRYSITYIGTGFSSKILKKTNLGLSAALGYVMVSDEDDHVLRYKRSSGYSTGSSVNFSGNLTYNFSPNTFIKLNGEYLFLTADGNQTQVYYAGALQGTTFKDIDLSIKSTQVLTSIGVGVRF